MYGLFLPKENHWWPSLTNCSFLCLIVFDLGIGDANQVILKTAIYKKNDCGINQIQEEDEFDDCSKHRPASVPFWEEESCLLLARIEVFILLARREVSYIIGQKRGGQVQSNFLKSYISSLFVASLSYNRCYFCGK